MSIKVHTCALPGVLLLELTAHRDNRGELTEVYAAAEYEALGIAQSFVQDNVTHSAAGVLRGLHFQMKQPQGKLLSVLCGKIFDVIVDVNPQSRTFEKHVTFELDATLNKQIWIPPGYAHGFYAVTAASVLYKCTQRYDPKDQHGILWSDPQLGIAWPQEAPLLSIQDTHWPLLSDSANYDFHLMKK